MFFRSSSFRDLIVYPMATITELLMTAHQHQEKGDLPQAEQLYKTILQQEPNQADAWNGLARLLFLSGKREEATQCLQRAVSLAPQSVQFLSNLGIAFESLKRLKDAEQCYQRAVQLNPQDAAVLSRLGLLKLDLKEFDQARDFLQRAHLADQTNSDHLTNLGTACKMLRQFPDALKCYEAAIQVNPRDASAYNNMGTVLKEMGKLPEAVAAYKKAIEINRTFEAAYSNLGNALVAQGKNEEAQQWYQKSEAIRLEQTQPVDALARYQEAVRRFPNQPGPYIQLGNFLLRQDRGEEALQVYLQGLKNNPGNYELLFQIGVVHREAHRYNEAGQAFKETIQAKPDCHEAYAGLGNALHQLSRYQEAEQLYVKAASMKPDYSLAYYNLGLLYQEMSLVPKAIEAYDRVLQLQPDHQFAKWNRGCGLLRLGDFERGWNDYELRWTMHKMRPPQGAKWEGQNPAGKTLLVTCEQGFGDTFQFVRYLPFLKQAGAKVLLVCPPKLTGVLKSCPGIDQLISDGEEAPPYDAYVSLLSLPRIFRTRLDSIPAPIPYLAAEKDALERWGKVMQGQTGIKIGVVWHGSDFDPYDSMERPPLKRSFPLDQLARVASIPNVRLISLQVGKGTEEVGPAKFPVNTIPKLDERGAFLDTAAIMPHLQLIISVDSSTAHLAGAMGLPVWVPLPYTCDWRWLMQGNETPWYPSMRLFRQTQPGDWKPVFDQMAQVLEQLIKQQGA